MADLKDEIMKTAACEAVLQMPEEWNISADVVVAGFGGAGAAAAIEAHDAGADVVILEKEARGGGCTRVSMGGIYCAGTSLQKELGVEDSVEDLRKFYMACANFGGRLTADPELIKVAADQSPEIFEWCKGLGISFRSHLWEVPTHFHIMETGLSMTGQEQYPEFASVTPPKNRTHWCNGAGQALFAALAVAVNKRGMKVMYNTAIQGLIADSKRRVCGVRAESKGQTIHIRAKKGVILTTGGHGYNEKLAKGLTRSYESILSPIHIIPYCNTGDGISLALGLGADYWANDGACALPMGFILPPPPPFLVDRLLCQPIIFVNKEGKRYVNETWYMAMQAIYLERQEDHIGWAIADSKAATALGKDMVEENVGTGMVVKGDSIKSLAEAIGVNAENLEKTIATWNENSAKGEDPEWKRTYGFGAIDTSPFYATGVFFAEGNESTGVKINTKAQVVNIEGKVIPGLYAAGRTSGGQFGELYPGCGTSIMTSLLFGRIAGKSAAAERTAE
jgi:succinate dehydrogenase/fumarate reductase flavoprotein subunit